MNYTIDKVKVLRDNKTNEFVKAYAEINGKLELIEGHHNVEKLLIALRKERKVEKLNELPRSVFATKFVYDRTKAKQGKFEVVKDLDSWESIQNDTYRIQKSKLTRKSPYTNKKASKLNLARVAGVALAAGLAITSLTACVNKFRSENTKEEASDIMRTTMETTPVVTEKKAAPNTWEEYVDEYEESHQKKFLVQDVMNENMLNAVKTVTFNDQDKMVGIPASQVASGILYYAGPLYSNEELASIVADYDLTVQTDSASALVAEVNKYLFSMGLNVMYAKNIDEVYIPVTGDAVADEINAKIFKLLYEATHATTEEEKAQTKKALQEAMKEYHVDGETKINLQEHPAADIHLEVVNEVSMLHTALTRDRLFSDGYSKMYFGLEANYNNEGKETTPRIKGRNDEACAILDARMTSAMEYIRSLDEEETKEATKDSYSLPYMYDLMDDYLVRTMGFESVDDLRDGYNKIYQESMAIASSTEGIGEFNPFTNPAGGKKGDTFTQTETGVTLSESELTDSQNQAAQAAAGIADANNQAAVEEEKKKAEEAGKLKYADVYGATFNYFAGESVRPTSASYNPGWASDSRYSQAWNDGKKDGEDYKRAKEAEGTKDNITEPGVIPGTITTDGDEVYDPNKDGEYAGDHENNPNQQNQNQEQQQQDEEEAKREAEEEAKKRAEEEAKKRAEEEAKRKAEEQAIQQNNQVSITVEDTIEAGYDGEVITDGEGVWDPSQYETYSVEDVDLSALYDAAYGEETESYEEEEGHTKSL